RSRIGLFHPTGGVPVIAAPGSLVSRRAPTAASKRTGKIVPAILGDGEGRCRPLRRSVIALAWREEALGISLREKGGFGKRGGRISGWTSTAPGLNGRSRF
ncbi:MAG: hypothetical protein AB1898_32445, partial [Acidobacteriota bacterium]